jgi:hypothetical protein
MKFDTTGNNIILISYPSGGFGNFLYYILSEFAVETVKVLNEKFKISIDGDSHSVKKYTHVYFHDPDYYDNTIDLDPGQKKILVLCDNGINNDSYDKIKSVFPNATILRAVIDHEVRPVVYNTMSVKAIQDYTVDQAYGNRHDWDKPFEPYAIRENITLLYHSWPFTWHPQESCINFNISELVNNPVTCLTGIFEKLNLTVQNTEKLKNVCAEWALANKEHISPYTEWQNINQALDNLNLDFSLIHIKDFHTQGYINYKLEEKYSISIKVWDYRDWFKTVGDILEMVKNEKKFTSD